MFPSSVFFTSSIEPSVAYEYVLALLCRPFVAGFLNSAFLHPLFCFLLLRHIPLRCLRLFALLSLLNLLSARYSSAILLGAALLIPLSVQLFFFILVFLPNLRSTSAIESSLVAAGGGKIFYYFLLLVIHFVFCLLSRLSLLNPFPPVLLRPLCRFCSGVGTLQ